MAEVHPISFLDANCYYITPFHPLFFLPQPFHSCVLEFIEKIQFWRITDIVHFHFYGFCTKLIYFVLSFASFFQRGSHFLFAPRFFRTAHPPAFIWGKIAPKMYDLTYRINPKIRAFVRNSTSARFPRSLFNILLFQSSFGYAAVIHQLSLRYLS